MINNLINLLKLALQCAIDYFMTYYNIALVFEPHTLNCNHTTVYHLRLTESEIFPKFPHPRENSQTVPQSIGYIWVPQIVSPIVSANVSFRMHLVYSLRARRMDIP